MELCEGNRGSTELVGGFEGDVCGVEGCVTTLQVLLDFFSFNMF